MLCMHACARAQDYLVSSSDPLAIRYNDRAPLENHHLAAAFTLLRTPDLSFLAPLRKPDYERLRKVGHLSFVVWEPLAHLPPTRVSVFRACHNHP